MGRVAVVQLVSKANVHDNLCALEPLFKQAKSQEVDLIVLPENFAFMGHVDTDKFKCAEEYGQGVIQQTISELAKRYGIWVVAGTIPIKNATAKRVRASCIVYNHQGNAVACYDKIHLFDVCIDGHEEHKESQTIEPGSQVVVVDTPVGCVGLSVCYDIRFPELYRQMVLKGAEILTVPAAFTEVTGRAHWDTLLRARAIENVCYVLAANQGGMHDNGRHTYGHSMVVNPWGKILGQPLKISGIAVAEIDLQELHQLRRQLPCNDHHVL